MMEETTAAKIEEELVTVRSWYDEQFKALAFAQQAGKCASWVMDVVKREVKWHPGGYEIFGIPFSEIEGRIRPVDLVVPEDRPSIFAALQQTIEHGAPFIVEYRRRWPNGELHWQEARGVLDADFPNLIRGTTFDITERKNAELSLLRVEKLAAVGRIASTIAHEINNPLESITNLLYLALLDTHLPEPVRSYLLTAQEELSRLSNVTRLTLSYARPQGTATVIDPGSLIDSVLFLFRQRIQAKGIEVVDSREPVRVLIFVDELQRILTNLIANSIEAVGYSGGVLRITVRPLGSYSVLQIEDNGSGISPERIARIFDPFFTTKEEVGTGIGLWVTKELVEKNGGTIAFVSGDLEDGMKTRCEISFPSVDLEQS
jgi:signal transduction histidine kinase